jgi:hydroxymethylpyrimidine pyrophosphatase-like HAD family hydrolase
MGNAVPQVREAAARSTLHHDQHGVAHAIDRMLEGEW